MHDQTSQDIKQSWNQNPVGNNFITYEKDKSFYEKYIFRYSMDSKIIPLNYLNNLHMYPLIFIF